MTFAGVDPIYEPDPRPAGRALPHGRSRRRTSGGAPSLEGLYAAGEVACVSVHGANRLGGNCAHGDDHVRQARRAGSGRAARSSRERRPSQRPAPSRPMPSASSRRSSTARRASGRGRSVTSSPAPCSRTSASSAIRSDGASSSTSSRGSASAIEHVVVEDKGDIFNSDLTQALELEFHARPGVGAWCRRGLAREESRGAHSRPSDFPERDDERFLRHSITRWEEDAPVLSTEEVR